MQAGSGSKGKATFVFRDQSYSWSNIKVLSFLWIVFSCPAITKSSKVSTEIVMQMSSVLNLMSFLWNLLPLAFTNLMPLHWHPYLMKCFDWSCAFVWCSLHPDNGSYMQCRCTPFLQVLRNVIAKRWHRSLFELFIHDPDDGTWEPAYAHKRSYNCWLIASTMRFKIACWVCVIPELWMTFHLKFCSFAFLIVPLPL